MQRGAGYAHPSPDQSFSEALYRNAVAEYTSVVEDTNRTDVQNAEMVPYTEILPSSLWQTDSGQPSLAERCRPTFNRGVVANPLLRYALAPHEEVPIA